ncbi:CTP synthase, partial [Candidatus Saccharibacteria bacterium]|nr:CTP synthase [Candidatus Saccharibacteria bacterium]
SQKHLGDTIFAHVVYVPYLKISKEFKTRPAQYAVRDLRSFGISPNFIVARVEEEPDNTIVRKVALFGGVPEEHVVVVPNADTVLRVPLLLHELGIDEKIMKHLQLRGKKPDLSAWNDIVKKATTEKSKLVKIGIVAKYLNNEDTYISVVEALKAAAWHTGVKLICEWINAEDIERYGTTKLKGYDGLLVPGGFGTRGVEGKVIAARYALEKNIPYLGLCLGLQVAVIAASRRSGLLDATSGELDAAAEHQVIYIMENQRGKEATGGTMRLGDHQAILEPKSIIAKLYGGVKVTERHRHRYEVNLDYLNNIEKGGLIVSGKSPDGKLVEFVEAPKHRFFVATQAHPEFRSRPTRPHPLFLGFIKAARS